MLKINTKDNQEEGRWVEYVEGVEFKVRPLTASTIKKLRKPFVTLRMKPDPRSGQMMQVEDFNKKEEFEDALNDYIIEDWKGVGDQAGNLLEATIENKKKILDNIPIRDFIWAAAQSSDIDTGASIKN